jgi:hypothetical protein
MGEHEEKLSFVIRHYCRNSAVETSCTSTPPIIDHDLFCRSEAEVMLP